MCNCILQVNEQLKEHNTQLDTPIWMTPDPRHSAVFLSTVKLDKSKRGTAKRVIAAYCPFCGKSVDEDGDA